MKKNNYYMIITSLEDFKIDLKNKITIIGLPDRNESGAKKLNIGDKIVYYISKLSGFGGIAEVTSEYFYDKKKIWTDPYDLWPHRLLVKPVYIIYDLNNVISIRGILGELDFIKNRKKWGVYVQGSIKKLSKHDYETILKKLKEN